MTDAEASASAVWQSPRFRTALAYASILVLPWVLMHPALGFEFSSDDRIMIVENQQMRSPSNWPRMLTTDAFDRTIVGFDYNVESLVGHYRPISKLSFLIDYTLWGPSETAFHAVGIVIHLLCGCLLLALMRQLGLPLVIATVASLVFVLHPVTARAIGLVSLRSDLWCGLFGMAAVIAALRGWERRQWGYHAAAGVLALLSLFGKEAGIFVPPLIVGLALAYHGWRAPAWRLVARDAWPAALAVPAYLVVRFGLLDIATGQQNDFPPMSLWTLFQSLSRLLFSYLTELPAPTLVDRLWLPEILVGLPPASVWLSWVVIGAVFAGAIAAIGRRHLAATAGLGLVLLPTLPLLNIWAISGEDVGEILPFEMHRLYVPAMGYALLWALAATNRRRLSGGVQTAATAGLVLAAAIPVWRYPFELNAYQDTEAMVRRKLDFVAGFEDGELPTSLRMLRLNLRSIELKRAGDLDGAEAALAEIQRLQPNDPIALKNLAVLALMKGEPDRTIEYLERVLNPLAQRTQSGEMRVVIDDLQLRHTGQVHKLLGRAYQMKGDLASAREHLTLSRQIDPTDLEVVLLLAFVAEKQGEREASRQYLRDFLAEAPPGDRRRAAALRRLEASAE